VADRSPGAVVAELGVWFAGGTCLLLDHTQPAERSSMMIEDAHPVAVVLAGPDRTDIAPTGPPVLDLGDGSSAGDTPESAVFRGGGDALAYLIYTSGSTGRPKGVLVGHASLGYLVDWHITTYDVSPQDRASSIAAITFDAFVWEVWPYLSVGASVHFIADELKLDPFALGDWYADQKITLSFLPTPLAEAYVRDGTHQLQLRCLLTGGDRLRLTGGHDLRRLVNHYGPTEATVVTTSADVRPDAIGAVEIGRPISSARVAVVDESGSPVAEGDSGQLVISGTCLALGYWNDPELTISKFRALPALSPGSRWYHSGDLVCDSGDGRLVYLGRLDRQVKVRGVRVEPGEIEATLANHPDVANVVVAPDPVSGALVAFVEPSRGRAVDVEVIASSARENLPAVMVPQRFVLVQAIPLTPHGKVDVASLIERHSSPTG
jgi:amino acid adenylation domain-containing protein